MPEKLFDYLKQSSHRLPPSFFRIVNEGFEVARGFISSMSYSSKDIKNVQLDILEKRFESDVNSLIIFLTPGIDVVNGGILSINSLFKETERLRGVHGYESVLCTYPSDPPLLRYSNFQNDAVLFDFHSVLTYFKKLENLLIHVPEHFVHRFYWFISKKDRVILRNIKNVQINITIQNLDYLPPVKQIWKLNSFGKLTGTTAHAKYSSLQLRRLLGFPLHKLSVFVSPEQYIMRRYREKDNLMIVSPDNHPRKLEVLRLIRQNFPQLEIKIIRNMTYENYKDTISRAKWALTFGEGLDGYFVEPVFSGSVSFSVYNPSFFTSDFAGFRTVYPSYNDMIEKICEDISSLDAEQPYTEYQREQFSLCHKYYDYREYVKNLNAFYKGEYTFS